MVILHNLLQENNLFVFFNSKSQEEKIEDEGKESFLEIFIYFQLLSMFCRCKAAKVVRYGIAVLGRLKKHCCFISFLAFYGLLTRFLCLTFPKNLNSQGILWRGFEISFMRGDIKVVNLQYFLWPNTSFSLDAGWMKENIKLYQKIAPLYGIFILIIILTAHGVWFKAPRTRPGVHAGAVHKRT